MRSAIMAGLVLLAALTCAPRTLAMPAPPGSIGPYRYGPYGCNLRWNNCLGDGGAINRNFTCDTNSGVETLVGSFVPAWDINSATGIEIVMDLASAGTTMPAWWSFKNAGACRIQSIATNFVLPATAVGCADWSNGQAAGGIGSYNIGLRGANTARVTLAIAVPLGAATDLVGRKEYFAVNLHINHSKTVGTGACGGCSTPVCIVLNRTKMTTPVLGHETYYVQGPSNLTDSDYATWQGGAGVSASGTTGCPAATPSVRSTWGAVKSLYR